jgi:uncharacterized protein (TIGR03083 family)
VNEPGYQVYGVAAYLDALRHEGELLAAAAARAGMAAAVPSCPGWQVADLLRHTSYVHRWAAGIVAQRLASPPAGLPEEEVLRLGPGDGELVDWFRAGHAALVATLAQAPPDLDCWSFLAAGSPLAFWARRQAHETAIHRVDAEQAAAGGPVTPEFGPAFAADGVDELVMGFLGRSIKRGSWQGLGGDLNVRAEDGEAHQDWLVAGQDGGASVTRGTGPAGCRAAGPARDLYLLLWNRGGTAGLSVTGDQAILTAFGQHLHITW